MQSASVKRHFSCAEVKRLFWRAKPGRLQAQNTKAPIRGFCENFTVGFLSVCEFQVLAPRLGRFCHVEQA